MAKPRPKTGERREKRMPLSIDRLGPSVHDALTYLHNQRGKGWVYIEALSALPYSAKWKDSTEFGKKGFVDWDSYPREVLELFPTLKLSHSSLHRWWDLRVSQVARDIEGRASAARALAQIFVGSGLAGEDDAVMNGARDLIFELTQAQDAKGRDRAARALLALAELRQIKRTNDLRERKVSVEERRVAAVESQLAMNKEKFERETAKLAKKIASGKPVEAADLYRITARVWGQPPPASGE